MSHAATCVPLYMAQRACAGLKTLLDPVCERVTIAGSVRRECETVNDLEVVAIPRTIRDPESLFARDACALKQLCERISRNQVPGVRRRHKSSGQRAAAWGDRFRQLAVFDSGRWFAVDLFIVAVDTYGAQLAIRTGPAAFSKALVTSVATGGAMPVGWRLSDGRLHTPSGVLDTPDEESFFTALTLPLWRPRVRTLRRLQSFLLHGRESHAGTVTKEERGHLHSAGNHHRQGG